MIERKDDVTELLALAATARCDMALIEEQAAIWADDDRVGDLKQRASAAFEAIQNVLDRLKEIVKAVDDA